ncbi:shikimate dehydrogenase [Georgenia sp. MJ206]|uniref:shikimate dehydrogenase n=1 Tax=Georgenia wangjunii TaxID=3117730 RepID=UPI002F26BFE8
MRRAALFGLPLNRRHSPAMHNAAFAAFGIDGEYVLRELTADELPAEVERARAERWFGFQITAPHKQAIMALLDEVEPAAAAIGAANCVEVRPDGRLVGFNTDVLGFMAGLAPVLTRPLAGSHVVIAGSGGAARSAVYGIAGERPAHITIVARRLPGAQRLADEYAALAPIEAMALDDDALDDRLGAADLFVNATTVGMLSVGPVVPVTSLKPGAAVYDIVYVPRETELLRQARAAGHPVANGENMLVHQAAVTFSRWTGAPDPTAIMRAAAEPLFADPDARP